MYIYIYTHLFFHRVHVLPDLATSRSLQVGSLTEEYDLLPGDSLVAAGMVGYAGPFAGEYRQSFEKLWLSTEDPEKVGQTGTDDEIYR